MSATDRFAYRPALDGLRAVAVLGVILYHLGYTWLPGGFAGVDVFFVLSGFLITGHLLAEQQRSNSIHIGHFWGRRVRRLLPALLLLVAVVAYWVGTTAAPADLSLRRGDLLWTMFYGANWHFIFSDQDYFAQLAAASPLRHAWSLAIEEQFYLVWPLLVASVALFGRHRRVVLLGLTVAGIALSTAAAAWLFDPGNLSRAYYGTDSRIHQPLVGALLAIVLHHRPAGARAAGTAAATAGLLAVASAFFWLDDRNPAYYYGLSLGIAGVVALTIWALDASPSGAVARLLSWQPVRWVGTISYGLYLWHWPIILAITQTPAPLESLPGSTGLNLTRLAVTFAIATASFYLLEQPIRQSRRPWLGASAVRFATSAALVSAAVATLVVVSTRGVSRDPMLPDIQDCAELPCLRHQGSTGAPVVALIGDSIARSIDPALMQLAEAHDWTYVLAAANACRISPLLTSVRGVVTPSYRNCFDVTPGRLVRLIDVWQPTTIIALDRFEITDFVEDDGRTVRSGTPEHLARSEEALAGVARELTARGAQLTFIELLPTVPASCGARERMGSRECDVSIGTDLADMPYNGVFRRLSRTIPRVSSLSLSDVLCPGGVCRWEVDAMPGVPVRYDGVHFSPQSSTLIAPALYEKLRDAGELPTTG